MFCSVCFCVLAILNENANTSVINLAKKITDEMVIIIYTNDEVQNSNVVDTVIKYVDKECNCPNIKNDGCINNEIDNINIVDIDTEKFNKDLIIIPAYAAKGLEFDSVIIINNFKNEKYLFYVAITRSQHELIVFNSTN